MLVDLKPKFLRFPGGNYLEGITIATRFDWKKTLGPLTQRCPDGPLQGSTPSGGLPRRRP